MKPLRLSFLLLIAGLAARGDDVFFDRVADALTVSAADGRVRARLSGTLEFEAYDLQVPAGGVIDTANERLFVPRLSLFLDAQLGQRIYAFAQVRADRGFDPGSHPADARLDEYALRFTPWKNGILSVQAGKFATVVGNWTNRHGSWSNPFITAPLPYENLTGIWDSEAVRSSGELLQWSHVRPGLPRSVTEKEKSLRVPIVWGPSYVPGIAVAGDVGRLRYAGEMKLGSLSSRPETWSHGAEQWTHPTFSGRVGYRPNQMWDIGFSASTGAYLREFAERSLAPRRGRGSYRQTVVAQDIAFAWHHLQIWTEIYASRFAIPFVGDADTVAYYAEAKYKFTPRWFGALRWNQQVFDTIPDRGTRVSWGQDVWRIDAAPGFRFTPNAQLKFQYSLQHGDSGRRTFTRTLASQLTLRF